jgi:hypothetical protein
MQFPASKPGTRRVVFANNVTLSDLNNVGARITTEAVPIDGESYATGITNIQKMFNAVGAGLTWQMEVSIDGQTFLPQGPWTGGALSAEGTTLQTPTRVSGAFARLWIKFNSAAGLIGATTFAIIVDFDRL